MCSRFCDTGRKPSNGKRKERGGGTKEKEKVKKMGEGGKLQTKFLWVGSGEGLKEHRGMEKKSSYIICSYKFPIWMWSIYVSKMY